MKDRALNYHVLTCGTFLVWKKRGEGDIWTGLYDFPDLALVLPSWGSKVTQSPSLFPKKYRHLLSHQRLLASFWESDIPAENLPQLNAWCIQAGFELVDLQNIDSLPKPKLIVNYLSDRGI